MSEDIWRDDHMRDDLTQESRRKIKSCHHQEPLRSNFITLHFLPWMRLDLNKQSHRLKQLSCRLSRPRRNLYCLRWLWRHQKLKNRIMNHEIQEARTP